MIHFGPAGFAAAFAAGFVSFVSPCVLPLIPGYLSFISGVGFDELGSRPRLVVGRTASFVLGFGAMFALLGAGSAWFGNVLLTNRRSLEIAAGAFLGLAGVVFAGLPLPRGLLAERRLEPVRPRGPITACLAGIAFAIGWTPCIGPTLAAILTLAAASDGGAARGAILLVVYSLGLGVPFLLFGLAFTRALGVVGVVRRNWRLVSGFSGALMVAFGVLIATGELAQITARLARFTGLNV